MYLNGGGVISFVRCVWSIFESISFWCDFLEYYPIPLFWYIIHSFEHKEVNILRFTNPVKMSGPKVHWNIWEIRKRWWNTFFTNTLAILNAAILNASSEPIEESESDEETEVQEPEVSWNDEGRHLSILQLCSLLFVLCRLKINFCFTPPPPGDSDIRRREGIEAKAMYCNGPTWQQGVLQAHVVCSIGMLERHTMVCVWGFMTNGMW